MHEPGFLLLSFIYGSAADALQLSGPMATGTCSSCLLELPVDSNHDALVTLFFLATLEALLLAHGTFCKLEECHHVLQI